MRSMAKDNLMQPSLQRSAYSLLSSRSRSKRRQVLTISSKNPLSPVLLATTASVSGVGLGVFILLRFLVRFQNKSRRGMGRLA